MSIALSFFLMEVLMMTDKNNMIGKYTFNGCSAYRPRELSTTKVWSVGERAGENRWLVWFPFLCHYHQCNIAMSIMFTMCCSWITPSGEGWHPPLKREDRLRKQPFAGFGTVMEDIKRSAYTKNQPILLASFWENVFLCFYIIKSSKKWAKIEPK